MMTDTERADLEQAIEALARINHQLTVENQRLRDENQRINKALLIAYRLVNHNRRLDRARDN